MIVSVDHSKNLLKNLLKNHVFVKQKTCYLLVVIFAHALPFWLEQVREQVDEQIAIVFVQNELIEHQQRLIHAFVVYVVFVLAHIRNRCDNRL